MPITKADASVRQINYTYNKRSRIVTTQLPAGGKNGGQLCWEFGGFGSRSALATVVTNPTTNGGDYAEISLLLNSTSNGAVEVHFSMLRGSPGFYITPIWTHRVGEVAMGTGEERDNIKIAPYFNWMSVDDKNDRQYPSGALSTIAYGAPQECSLFTTGFLQGQYEISINSALTLGSSVFGDGAA